MLDESILTFLDQMDHDSNDLTSLLVEYITSYLMDYYFCYHSRACVYQNYALVVGDQCKVSHTI